MTLIFENNAVSTLAVTALLADVTLQVQPGHGSRFPTPAPGESFFVTVQNGTLFEIMRCTARSGDVLTVIRAEDGTAAQTWNTGSSVDMRVNAGVLETFAQTDEVAETYVPLGAQVVLPADPVLPDEAATKRYVDAQVAAAVAATVRNAWAPMVGKVAWFAGWYNVPAGWIEAGGQAVSRTTYAVLLDRITGQQLFNSTAGSPWIYCHTTQWPIGGHVEGPGIPVGSVVVEASGDGHSVRLSNNVVATQVDIMSRYFAYGQGDGSTTFNVPDYRGVVVAGASWLGGTDADRIASVGGTAARRVGGRFGSQWLHIHGHGVNDPGHAHTAWTDEQGWHDHGLMGQTVAPGPGFQGGGSYGYAGDRTHVAGGHTHAVGVGGAGTGISIQAIGAGDQQNVQPTTIERFVIYTGVGV